MKVQTIEELIQEYYNNITPVDYAQQIKEFKNICTKYYDRSVDVAFPTNSPVAPDRLTELRRMFKHGGTFFKEHKHLCKHVNVYSKGSTQQSFYDFSEKLAEGYTAIHPNDIKLIRHFDDKKFIVRKPDSHKEKDLAEMSRLVDEAFAELAELEIKDQVDSTKAFEWATQRHEEQKKAFEDGMYSLANEKASQAAQAATLKLKAQAYNKSMLDVLLEEKRESYSFEELKAASELSNDAELAKLLKEKGLEKKRVDGATRWIPQQPLSAPRV